jgi:hypothetical protein
MTLNEFFAGQEESRMIFDTLENIIASLGPVDVRVTKSQVAFYQHRAFAWVWIPGKYLRGKQALLVLTVSLRRKDSSPRWKEIVEPRSGRFTHHLELYSSADLDDEVCAWLQEARSDAG